MVTRDGLKMKMYIPRDGGLGLDSGVLGLIARWTVAVETLSMVQPSVDLCLQQIEKQKFRIQLKIDELQFTQKKKKNNQNK